MQLLEPRRLLAAGDLDLSFGDRGRVQTLNDSDLPELFATVFLPDGKILIAGTERYLYLSAKDQYIFKRFNADGTPDTTFGEDGIVTGNITDLETDDTWLRSIARAPDGKMYGVGKGGDDAFTSFVARFNPDGSLDNSYGDGDGWLPLLPEPTEQYDDPWHVEMASDGKLLVLTSAALLRRLLPDGTPDSTFGGGDGLLPKPLYVTTDLAFQGNRILAAGFESLPEGVQFAVARLNDDGSYDSTFGDDGIVRTSVGSSNVSSSINQVALLPDGKILAAGGWNYINAEGGGFALARYDANGNLDTTFGNAGVSMVSLGTGGSVGAINFDDDGNIILTSFNDLAVVRFSAEGQFDESFGRAVSFGSPQPGWSHFSMFTPGATIQSNGKLVVAGQNEYSIRGVGDFETAILHRIELDDAAPSPITFDAQTHVLTIIGTSEADVIEVGRRADMLYAAVNGFGRAFEAADVQRIDADAGDGNDFMNFAGINAPIHARGGSGIDRIAGGDRNDTLEGNAQRDYIDGGDGDDLVVGNGGQDRLRGLDGDDYLSGGAGNDFVQGNQGNDHIGGGASADILEGNEGDDTFNSAHDGAVDQLFGGAGNDSLLAADQDDILDSIET
jgi:uncharacterized delta-60 repeat protein